VSNKPRSWHLIFFREQTIPDFRFTMEKILKTIDALKMPSLSSSDANIPGTITSAVVAASDSVKTK